MQECILFRAQIDLATNIAQPERCRHFEAGELSCKAWTDSSPEAVRKLLSVKIACGYDLDVNSHSSLGDRV